MCNCDNNFIWISSNQTCNIDCTSFNSSGDVGSRVSSTADQCVCLNAGFLWNVTYLMCVIDCTVIQFAIGVNASNTNNSC